MSDEKSKIEELTSEKAKKIYGNLMNKSDKKQTTGDEPGPACSDPGPDCGPSCGVDCGPSCGVDCGPSCDCNPD